MRYIQRLKKAGYDFSTLPDDIQESVALLLTTNADNSKIDALDYTTLCAIRSVNPDDTEVQALYEISQNHSTVNENNGFNTASRLDDANVLFEPESPEKKSMEISFIDYKGSEIMYSPHDDEYFVDDEPFKSLESAKEFIDKGKPTSDWKRFAYSKGLFAEGGKTESSILFENNTLQIRNIGGDKVYYKKEGAEWVFLSPEELKQLEVGTKHELEHSSTIKSIKGSDMPVELIASAIAWDHITETLNYYEKLEKAIPEKKYDIGGISDSRFVDASAYGWKVQYFDPTDPSFDVEYVKDDYLIRIVGGGDYDDYSVSITKGDYNVDGSAFINLNYANDFIIDFMKSHSNSQFAKGGSTETITNSRSRESQKAQIKDISLKISDYKNPYALNLSIEKWIDDKIGADFDNALSRAYTPEEKQFLKGYSGYGGLGQYGEISVGSMFEFFTPLKVIETMWSLAYKYGYKSDGSVLEPACGTGEFLQFTNPLTRVVGYEINTYSAIVSKILYPHATIKLETFEKNFIANNFTIKDKTEKLEKFDLVIGNPPYGSFDVLDKKASRYLLGFGEKDFTKATNYVEYFLRRSLDLTKPGGLIVMIVGTEVRNGGTMFLDTRSNPVKDYLSENATLLDAYRLPDSVFERTGVTSDILVIQKNK
jgi:hypothetical protein